MMEYKFNWDKAIISDADRKEELTRFRERNGIVFSKPDYEDYRWCKKNRRRYKEELLQGKKPEPGKMFYRAEKGDIQQQNRIIDAVAQLNVHGTVPQTLLDRILADNPPLLRVKIKEEVKPGSMKFRGKTFDVVKTALVVAQKRPNRGGKSVLKQILPYIDFDYYKREREKILKIVLED